MQALLQTDSRTRKIKIFLNGYLPTHEEIDKCIVCLREYKAERGQPEQVEAKEKIIKNGYIYVLKSQNLYKIGKTKNPKSRFKRYIVENPHPIRIELLAWIPDYAGLEQIIHKQLGPKRYRGEWFDLQPQDLIAIEKILVVNGGMIMDSTTPP